MSRAEGVQLRRLTRESLGKIGATYVLFARVDCRKHVTCAARLITERWACIPVAAYRSVQRGNAAMPKPLDELPLAFLRSAPRGFAGTVVRDDDPLFVEATANFF